MWLLLLWNLQINKHYTFKAFKSWTQTLVWTGDSTWTGASWAERMAERNWQCSWLHSILDVILIIPMMMRNNNAIHGRWFRALETVWYFCPTDQGKKLPPNIDENAEEGDVSDEDSADEMEDDCKLMNGDVGFFFPSDLFSAPPRVWHSAESSRRWLQFCIPFPIVTVTSR